MGDQETFHYRGGQPSTTLLGRCRHLRRAQTDAEACLWQRLRAGQVGGAKVRRQHQFGPYILDFFCPEQGLVVEVDGGQHLSATGLAMDKERTAYLEAERLTVLRFSDREVLVETDSVVQAILMALEKVSTTEPSPQPSPSGRGSRRVSYSGKG